MEELPHNGLRNGSDIGEDNSEQKVVALLHSELPRVAGDIQRMITSGIRIETWPIEDGQLAPVGASRLGGNPDLPRGVSWPVVEGIPLGFIAQIYLPEAAPCDTEHALPHHGILYFFYDNAWDLGKSDPENWHVIYFEGDIRTLQRTSAPSPGLLEGNSYLPCSLTFSRIVTLPEYDLENEDRLALGEPAIWRVGHLTLTEQEVEIYDHVRHARLPEINGAGDSPAHQLLGYPDNIQGSPLPGPEWSLLFQVDSDERAGMMWADSGTLYYMIRQEDLQARDFSRVQMEIQSY